MNLIILSSLLEENYVLLNRILFVSLLKHIQLVVRREEDQNPSFFYSIHIEDKPYQTKVSKLDIFVFVVVNNRLKIVVVKQRFYAEYFDCLLENASIRSRDDLARKQSA